MQVGALQPGTLYSWRVDESTPGGTVTGDIWNFTTKSLASHVYEWDFTNGLAPSLGNGILSYADGNVTSNLTVFGTSDGSTVPHMNGVPVTYLRAPAFTGISNGYTATFPASAPNGGGAYINQYTMVFDILLPPPINWFPFFNTSPSNPSGNDADFYVAPDGSLGIAAIGYSAVGLIASNTWYRIAFAADLTSGIVTYYINGNPVCTGSGAIDGRHAIFSNANAGADLLLFNEGDTSGTYTHTVYLSSFLFIDRPMTASEISGLGGPKARGIMIPAPPITLSLTGTSANSTLTWSGGQSPFQVQRALALDGSWQNFGSATSATNMSLGATTNAAFFRVLGQWP